MVERQRNIGLVELMASYAYNGFVRPTCLASDYVRWSYLKLPMELWVFHRDRPFRRLAASTRQPGDSGDARARN